MKFGSNFVLKEYSWDSTGILLKPNDETTHFQKNDMFIKI